MLHTLSIITRCHTEKSYINGALFPYKPLFIMSATEWFKEIIETTVCLVLVSLLVETMIHLVANGE